MRPLGVEAPPFVAAVEAAALVVVAVAVYALLIVGRALGPDARERAVAIAADVLLRAVGVGLAVAEWEAPRAVADTAVRLDDLSDRGGVVGVQGAILPLGALDGARDEDDQHEHSDHDDDEGEQGEANPPLHLVVIDVIFVVRVLLAPLLRPRPRRGLLPLLSPRPALPELSGHEIPPVRVIARVVDAVYIYLYK
ncbi:MAG TPA: hypothetical protein DCS29_01505 [Candidatus Magasanikbacteria bacterium]|nr:hypothetical protein [Candidatus Magasanikbacteria bacterium]